MLSSSSNHGVLHVRFFLRVGCTRKCVRSVGAQTAKSHHNASIRKSVRWDQVRCGLVRCVWRVSQKPLTVLHQSAPSPRAQAMRDAGHILTFRAENEYVVTTYGNQEVTYSVGKQHHQIPDPITCGSATYTSLIALASKHARFASKTSGCRPRPCSSGVMANVYPCLCA